MQIDLPLPPDSLIRHSDIDRDVTVQLAPEAPFTVMKESQLQRKVGWHDDEDETAAWVEYRLNGVIVHRSAHVHIKKLLPPVVGEAAVLG